MINADGPGGPGPDEFEQRAREVLGSDATMLHNLLKLRTEVHQFAARDWPGTGQPSAEALNSRNQHMIDEAARVLPPDKFTELFGFAPGEKVNLVDPKVVDQAGELPPTGRR